MIKNYKLEKSKFTKLIVLLFLNRTAKAKCHDHYKREIERTYGLLPNEIFVLFIGSQKHETRLITMYFGHSLQYKRPLCNSLYYGHSVIQLIIIQRLPKVCTFVAYIIKRLRISIIKL